MSGYITEDGLDFRDPYEREIILQQRREEIAEKLKEKKERNKTYLKGQRGVRRYYDFAKLESLGYEDKDEDGYLNDYDDIDENEDDEEKTFERPIKCIFTRDLRRQKLYAYLKYLKGRKVLVRDLAWKFAVTERTIQSDLKYLIDNGYIERQINKTYLNRQTKNSYIVNLSKEKAFEYTGDKIACNIFVAKENDKYYILTDTDYDEKLVIRGKRNINDFTFELPNRRIKSIKECDNTTLAFLKVIFGEDTKIDGKFYGVVYSYLCKGKYQDGLIDKPERWEEMLYFSFVELDKCYTPKKNYKWITLNVAPRRIKQYGINKGIHFVAKNILGVK